MIQGNKILASLKETFASIRNHKALFLLLILVQAVFVVLLSVLLISYSTEIMKNAQEIVSYSEHLNLDENMIGADMKSQAEILGKDPLLMYQKFKKIINSIIILAAGSALLILFFNTANWGIAELFFRKPNLKEFLQHVLKLFFVNIVYLSILGALAFAVFQNFYLEMIITNGAFIFLAAALIAIILYFMLVSMSLSSEKLFDIFKKTISVGIRKFHFAFFGYAVILILLSLFFLLFFISQEKAFLLLMAAGFLFFLSFVFCRIFFIRLVRNIA